jgi:hypothetical protein
MHEFTLDIYELILNRLDAQGYIFSTFKEYISNHKNKAVIVRHDVDRLPNNSLQMAKLENRLGIKATYFFRIVKESYDENIIRQIKDMGHEIGYHYENLSLCRGNYELSILNFELNLEKLRKIYPVKTICMHGSPLSKYDNKKIWEKYDYRDYGIIAEPYFDIDFNEVFYITDTGRAWNNSKVSVRDKVPRLNPLRSSSAKNLTGQAKVNSKFDIKIKSTHHLIEKIQNNELPDKIMLNAHPHRWFDFGYNWYKELLMQNFKNQVKSLIVRLKDK